MSRAVQRRRGSTTDHASFTGLNGEFTYNYITKTIHVHDGSTTGGLPLLRADFNNFGGQIPFPATPVPSSDPNTIDDFEEGTFTPSITFATPGNLAVSYSVQVGRYSKLGRWVTVSFGLATSSFTHTTASGQLQIPGLPFTSLNVGYSNNAVLRFQGINKAGFSSVFGVLAGASTTLIMQASGMGVNVGGVSTADVASGGTVTLYGTVIYEAT